MVSSYTDGQIHWGPPVHDPGTNSKVVKLQSNKHPASRSRVSPCCCFSNTYVAAVLLLYIFLSASIDSIVPKVAGKNCRLYVQWAVHSHQVHHCNKLQPQVIYIIFRTGFFFFFFFRRTWFIAYSYIYITYGST